MIAKTSDVYGRLMGVPHLSSRGGVHQSYVGRVFHDHLGEVDVYLKSLDGKRMANELVAAAVADIVGVDVPPTFLVHIDDGKMEVHHRCGEKGLCLASRVVSDASDLRSTATLVAPEAISRFYARDEWKGIVAFDALIANSDRTPANLLRDVTGRLWAIDHDTAFGGDWCSDDLVADRHSTNLLARPGSYLPSLEMREEVLKAWSLRPTHVSFEEVVRLPTGSDLLTEEESKSLSLYLERRWKAMDELLRHALFNLH